MAWTNPKTWSVSEVLTAALLNTHLRDNLNILKTSINDDGTPDFISMKRLLSNFTKNNDTVLADVGELNFDIGASETWAFIAPFHYDFNATADLKMALTVPSGATGRYGIVSSRNEVATGSAAIGTDLDYQGTGLATAALLVGSVVNSTTAGTVQVQAAQNTGHASVSTIFAGSFIVAFKIG